MLPQRPPFPPILTFESLIFDEFRELHIEVATKSFWSNQIYFPNWIVSVPANVSVQLNGSKWEKKEAQGRRWIPWFFSSLFDHLRARATHACSNNARGLHTLYGGFGASVYKAERENGATSWSVRSRGWGWAALHIVKDACEGKIWLIIIYRGSDMRLLGGEGGGRDEICLLVFCTLVTVARAQLDILAQKVINISSSPQLLNKRTS